MDGGQTRHYLMTTETQTPPADAAQPLFYINPVPVHSDRHQNLRILPGPLDFAAGTNAIPLVVGDFAYALHHFPILFAGDAAVPMAALGFTQDNLFITDGQWDPDSYVPAYVRRHPFIFINTGDDSGDFALGVDVGSSRVVEGGDEGVALFEDGKPTDLIQGALEFCGQFTREHDITVAFCKALVDLDLLDTRNATARLPNGREVTLQGFRVIDSEKFGKLADDVVLDWHRKGWLALAHQHFMSLGRFGDLSRRQGLREA